MNSKGKSHSAGGQIKRLFQCSIQRNKCCGSGNRKLRMNENQQDLERDLMRQQGQNQRGVHAT